MRQGISEAATLNIIIIFIVIVFGLLIGAINYYKAFKVNSRVLDIIEKYEGYNSLAVNEIADYMDKIGYVRDGQGCAAATHGASLVGNQDGSFDYCIYYHSTDGVAQDPKGAATYYNYSVITYIYVDLPIINRLRIPVYTKGERIYKFSARK